MGVRRFRSFVALFEKNSHRISPQTTPADCHAGGRGSPNPKLTLERRHHSRTTLARIDQIVSSWQAGERRLLVAVNYGPTQAQGYVGAEMSGLRGRAFTLVDLLGDARYPRSGDDLADDRLYLDMPAWGYHVFELA